MVERLQLIENEHSVQFVDNGRRYFLFFFLFIQSMYTLLVILISFLTISGSPPIVLWHGMGDSCCNPLSLGSVVKLLKRQLPGPYVLSLRIGSNIVEDTSNGFFMNANHQIDHACQILKADQNLSQGYHAIG